MMTPAKQHVADAHMMAQGKKNDLKLAQDKKAGHTKTKAPTSDSGEDATTP